MVDAVHKKIASIGSATIRLEAHRESMPDQSRVASSKISRSAFRLDLADDHRISSMAISAAFPIPTIAGTRSAFQIARRVLDLPPLT